MDSRMQAVEKPKDAKPAGKPALKPLRPGDAVFYESTNTMWTVWAPQGSTPEEIAATPGFFDGLLNVRSGDSITVHWEDHSYLAEFRVIDAVPGCVDAVLWASGKASIR